MRLIRNNVFETNSSSCHSISIADDNKEFILDMLYPDDNGNIILNGGEFGWDWFKHNDAKTKANYAAQSFAYNEEQLEILKQVIEEQTGGVVIFENLEDGYIDHDSTGILSSNKDELKNFIFNKNSWLFGGNDNSTASPDFYIVPEYTKEGIIEPKYKYELSFNDKNITETYKFLDYPTDENFDDLIESLNPRYNKAKGVLEIDSNYWSGGEVYFENSYWYQQDIKTGYVVLVNSNFIKEQVDLKDISWEDRSNVVTKHIKNNLDNKDIVYKLEFTIKEL